MKKTSVLLLLVMAAGLLSAQPQRFQNEIAQFHKQDSLHMPAPNQILFIGSSSFTKWKDVQDYFPTHPIINRGFGGSSLPDVIYYANDIIFPYQPKQIVIYCGENDFSAPGGIEPEVVVNRVKELYALIRTKYPNIPVDYISMKPSPSREPLLEKMKIANKKIKKWLKRKKHAHFINVYDSMLNSDGSLRKEIYLQDNLHMNATGYKIWQKIIDPYLVD